MSKAELAQSERTWNQLRQSDRRILVQQAKLPSELWWNNVSWQCLTEPQQNALMQLDWNDAFSKA